MSPDIAQKRPSSFPPRQQTAQIQPGSVAPLLTRLANAKVPPLCKHPAATDPKPSCLRAANAPRPCLTRTNRTATVPPVASLRCASVMPVATQAARTPVALRFVITTLRAFPGGSGGFARGCSHLALLGSFRLGDPPHPKNGQKNSIFYKHKTPYSP